MFALDLDGTLIWSEPFILRALERRLGRSLEGRDPTRYDYFGISHLIPQEELDPAWREVLADPATYQDAQPYPGALEAAQWLSRRSLLRGYITARPPATLAATREWLQAWGFPSAPLVGGGPGGDRAEALRRMGAEVLVDDHPGAVELLDGGIHVLLVDRPYNRLAQHPRLWRFGGWEGFLTLFKTLPLDVRSRRDPLGWPEKKKGGYRGEN